MVFIFTTGLFDVVESVAGSFDVSLVLFMWNCCSVRVQKRQGISRERAKKTKHNSSKAQFHGQAGNARR
jgi:hypothetical protein